MCQESSRLPVFYRAGLMQQRLTWSGQLESETRSDEHSVSLWPFCVRSFSETSYFRWQQNGGWISGWQQKSQNEIEWIFWISYCRLLHFWCTQLVWVLFVSLYIFSVFSKTERKGLHTDIGTYILLCQREQTCQLKKPNPYRITEDGLFDTNENKLHLLLPTTVKPGCQQNYTSKRYANEKVHKERFFMYSKRFIRRLIHNMCVADSMYDSVLLLPCQKKKKIVIIIIKNDFLFLGFEMMSCLFVWWIFVNSHLF